MHFGLTEEQLALVDTVRTVVARRSSSTDLRDAYSSNAGYDETLWAILCDQVGVCGLAVPEAEGGVGYSSFETHIVLEELGRSLTPTPLLGSAVLCITALLYAANETARARLLPSLSDGSTQGALCWADDHGRWQIDRSGVDARFADGQWRLNGIATLVIGGIEADLLLAVANTEEGPALFAVSPDGLGVVRRPNHGVDPTLRFATVDFEEACGDLLGTFDGSLPDLYAAAATAVTALQVGGAQAALDRTVAYLKDRTQFERPLASFQSLKHRCADMLVAVETARSISWAAAWAAAERTPDLRWHAAIASSWCSEAFSHVAAEMVQLHGGIAITWEHDAHLFFKRAHATAQLLGSPREHRKYLATGASPRAEG
ncbi:alkylation response protein AidB-like acyl-CoA dehydrogenase [Rhodococcus fascians]|uniref:acyl-CoA dehydrogenase family protein n=1 Tax=Nocardiaceae TaxID=85025 RepID=UPI00286554C5|nr:MULTISPECIES: acyl-CoA dehydrogenase family protein [Rhodococcus]MDR6910768.1 alkylation response protein AidB-like acyl-CoA dehydrogenase [Rhodococcus sp. 3258]MDR6931865.1 alkylation response protein AidB-like acyl-CoA dehydrogenase [Rhodococcus fascians]